MDAADVCWLVHGACESYNLGALCAPLTMVTMPGPLMQDPHLQKRLQQVLKLNKEKWEEAREHALKAVVVDNRMRVWWASQASGTTLRVGAFPPPALLVDRSTIRSNFGMYEVDTRPISTGPDI
jgi:hypothetical protein